MSSDSKLLWVAIALSLLLVGALGTLAAYSVLNPGDLDQDTTTEVATGNVSTDGDQPRASPPMAIVDCGPSDDPSAGYTVVVTNPGTATVDYQVTIELAMGTSRPVVASTEIPALDPGERQAVTVNAAGSAGSRITGCSVAAIQSDRRVLLANS